MFPLSEWFSMFCCFFKRHKCSWNLIFVDPTHNLEWTNLSDSLIIGWTEHQRNSVERGQKLSWRKNWNVQVLELSRWLDVVALDDGKLILDLKHSVQLFTDDRSTRMIANHRFYNWMIFLLQTFIRQFQTQIECNKSRFNKLESVFILDGNWRKNVCAAFVDSKVFADEKII